MKTREGTPGPQGCRTQKAVFGAASGEIRRFAAANQGRSRQKEGRYRPDSDLLDSRGLVWC